MKKFYASATIEKWSRRDDDYVVEYFEAWVTAVDERDARDQAREDWSQHGHNVADLCIAVVPEEFA